MSIDAMEGAEVMESVSEIYDWVRATRKGLLDYCAELPVEVFLAEREDAGWGSMRNTLVHTASCYIFWLGETALGEDPEQLRYADFPDAASVAGLYARRVDPLVEEFRARFGGGLRTPLSLGVRWQPEPFVTTPLWVFTHMVTHEFHHKGQVVVLGRLHGYPAPDTDLAMPPAW